MKWLLHDLTFGLDEQDVFIDALKDLGEEYEIIKTYGDPPDADVVRCSINMAKFWHGHRGIICNWQGLRRTSYFPHFGDYLLSKHYIFEKYPNVIEWADTIFDTYGNNNCVFIAPNNGGKLFPGEIVDKEVLLKHADRVCWEYDLHHTMVLVAEPVNINREYRMIAVGDRVVSGSRYKAKHLSNLELDVERIEPDHQAFRYTQEVLDNVQYRPDIAFCIDVAENNNGFHVVELNSFTCCGLYDCDPYPIIESLRELI